MTTGRATVIDVGAPLDDVVQARAWLANAGEDVPRRRARGPEPRPPRIPARDRRPVPEHRRRRPGARGADRLRRRRAGRRRPVDRCAGAARPPAPAPTVEGAPAASAARSRLERTRAALACEELALRARLDLEAGRYREGTLQLPWRSTPRSPNCRPIRPPRPWATGCRSYGACASRSARRLRPRSRVRSEPSSAKRWSSRSGESRRRCALGRSLTQAVAAGLPSPAREHGL